MFLKSLDILTLLLLSGSVGAAHADWWTKHKRDIPADGGGIVIPLSTDALGRYVASVGMGNQGKDGPVQNLPFLLSTSSPTTAAAGVKCPACVAQIGSGSLYNATLSQTVVALNGTKTVTIGDSGIKGETISEVCGFRQQNGTFWWYPGQTVVLANDSRGFFANGAAGMIGLGRSGGEDSFVNNVFRIHQGWQNMSIGLALNGQAAAAAGNAGVMDVRAIDSSLYSGDIKYSPVINTAGATTDIPTNYPADWSLNLTSWTVDAGRVRTEHTTGGVAIVEPYFPEIRFPQDQAELFYRDVPGAVVLPDATGGTTWSIPCKPTLSLEVNFNGSPFTIGADQLTTGDLANNNCTGVVRAWDSPFVQSYMLGKAFAETVYIVYNANRNGSAADTIGFAPRNGSQTLSDSRMSAGAVAGIAVGVTIAFFLLLLIAFLWWRHKRAVRVMETKPLKDGKGQHKIQPWTPTSSSTPMFNLSHPPPNGPYVIEQGPIGGEVGPSTTLLSSVTPEASPSTATMSASHRRKAEEAGYTSTGGTGSLSSRVQDSRRPPSTGTHTSGSEFIQGLPPLPVTPHTPESQGQHAGRFSTVPSSPGGAVGGPGVRPATLPAAPPGSDPQGRHVSTMLSPTSPQIHYHIHVTPETAAARGFLPSNMPAGSVIHEYPNDEPAPEYTERRASHISEASEAEEHVDIPSPPLTANSQHPLHHT